ncbi:BnaC09g42030D [Brassica napus]|uniref:RING-type E3 ubiquitin transferase n=1 Tax=Brassica napus TaxID=3708 RepID=A0A078GIY9_BRANA|nr:uncharacterized protein BNAC09G42030D [Brassica napus]CAF1783045.1 unnamed protein product [Brassica napus]CDY26465.1 BnaC09g42030D [Brassica napus]
MAKLFGFPINVEEDGGRGGGGGSSTNAEASRSAMNLSAGLPQRETNPYPRFSESGSSPMDSESNLENSFIDFFGRESHEIETAGRNQMQRVSRGVDMEEDGEIDLRLGIGSGAGSGQIRCDSVTGDKETDSGRVEAGTDLIEELFCAEEEEGMLMADDEVLDWELDPVQPTSHVEEGDELALPVNNYALLEDFNEEALDDFMMGVFEGSSIMDVTYEDILAIFPEPGGDDHVDYFDVFVQPFDQEPSVMASPPASKRVVDELPVVEITSEELSSGNIACAICIGDFVVKEKVSRLPCWHYYHGECILPWLEMKNTCPVCRFELPTDDLEYERNRRDHRG